MPLLPLASVFIGLAEFERGFGKRLFADMHVCHKLLKAYISNDVIESLESCLADYVPLIRSAMDNDEDLAKSKESGNLAKDIRKDANFTYGNFSDLVKLFLSREERVSSQSRRKKALKNPRLLELNVVHGVHVKSRRHHEDEEQEKTRNCFSLASLLEVNPQTTRWRRRTDIVSHRYPGLAELTQYSGKSKE
ncbi:hypothetical protein Tco_0448585 [Tanacetum coccineum]